MLANNKTNFVSANSNGSRCNSSSGSCSPLKTCPGTAIHLTYISIICVVGVISNVILLYADYKEWKKRKTPDKVLILNLAMTNIVALLLGLPFHAVVVANFKDILNCVGDLFRYYLAHDVLHLCNFVTLGTLFVVGLDRYEALTKFAHQRTLDVKKSILAIGLVWLCSIAVSVLFLLSRSNQCTKFYSFHSPNKKTDDIHTLRAAIVSIWITVCCTVMSKSLVRAARQIRQHRQEINGMLGQAQAAVEISFTKGIIALSLSYIIFWIPYGVSSALLPSDQYNITLICLKLWTNSICYASLSFSLLPAIYFIVDNRLRRTVLPQPTIAAAPIPMTTNNVPMTTNTNNTAAPKS